MKHFTYGENLGGRPSLKRMREAFEAGAKAASELAQGHLFTGSWGAAEALGFFEPKELREVFSEAYLSALADRRVKVLCDEYGVVVKMEPLP